MTTWSVVTTARENVNASAYHITDPITDVSIMICGSGSQPIGPAPKITIITM